ncbi:FdhF/YdeP family oxidoreductase [Streptomyces sp. 4N509B]|uniref:FdhF/YdeP family oxidoreductase n=1 Tax=Streptomyces sp. 4N509B TaxID=3457413 RepID=UPI003FD2A20B
MATSSEKAERADGAERAEDAEAAAEAEAAGEAEAAPEGAPGEPPAGPDAEADGEAPYPHPTAGWGAARSVGRILARTRTPVNGTRALLRMNHEDKGFDCPGCAWPDDPGGLHLDICENGVKHAAWEMTPKRADRAFFAAPGHTVTELMEWSDTALEEAGRLTEPMFYDPDTDRYRPVSWDEAFTLVGDTLRGLDSPDRATFYTSGRLSNEASFLYQLMVREYGTNNLPDCSNMCHEASGRALRASLGTNKGTVDLGDWEQADAIFLIGSNAASNAPRMLTSLAHAHRRGARVVHVNPLVEAAAGRTIVPHEFRTMATRRATPTGSLNLQPRIGSDLALLRGIAKATIEAGAVDTVFLDRFTEGYEAYRDLVAVTEWEEITEATGLTEAQVREAAEIYAGAGRTIIAWCLGITQQEHGVDTMREIVNVLLLRGNIGRPGAGPCPIRGHSNVQGNRTCGITHRPAPEFLDRLAEVCGIDPPRRPGADTVRSIEAMHAGEITVFVGMGGNFALAAPDTSYTFEALRRCALTVQVSTKLNRSHLVHGRRALILPCLGRSERDRQPGGEQALSVEDSMSMVHLSRGMKRPASRHLRSEPAIIAGIARAVSPYSRIPWDTYGQDYDSVREVMARALDGFDDFNRRVRRPGGFRIHQPARERIFLTGSGRAEFSHAALPDAAVPEGMLRLGTVRSHDQWNTTIYSDDDRYRGVKGLRTLVFMNAADMRERGLAARDLVTITSHARDGSRRTLSGYQAIPYDLPRGCAMGYMPEMNELCPIGDFSPQSDQPMMKHLTVDIRGGGGR